MGISPRYNRKVNQGYADYISTLPWDAFYTVTCRTPRKDNIALIRDIKNVIDGSVVDGFWGNYVSPDYRSFIAIEPHRFTGFIHAHGLLGWNDDDLPAWKSRDYSSGLERELRHFFGFSKVSPVKSFDAVSMYCAKYVTKERGEYDYDFLGKW